MSPLIFVFLKEQTWQENHGRLNITDLVMLPIKYQESETIRAGR